MALLALKSSGEHQVSLNPMMGKKHNLLTAYNRRGRKMILKNTKLI